MTGETHEEAFAYSPINSVELQYVNTSYKWQVQPKISNMSD